MRNTLATLAAAALAGCGALPFEYQSQREIPAGPGLFSGAEGAFVLRAGGDTAGAKTPPPERRDAEEYREFQEWRKRRRDAKSSAVK